MAVTVNVSIISATASSVIGVRNWITVTPGAKEADVAGTKLVPSKTSSSAIPMIPKSKVSPSAVTPMADKSKSMASNVGLLSSTVNAAKASEPSVTITSLTEIVGVSLSTMSVVTSKSIGSICRSSSEPPVTESMAIVKSSSGSPSESSMV